MNEAQAILRHVRGLGGDLHVVGNDLIVDAPKGALSTDDLAKLRDRKPEVMDLVTRGFITPPNRAQHRNTREEWTARDWRAFYDERAGIAEHLGEVSRAIAEVRAFECTVVAWLNHNPAPENGPDQCAHCGGTTTAGDALPYLNAGGYVWLHADCHADWMRHRRAEAVEALRGMGINNAGT